MRTAQCRTTFLRLRTAVGSLASSKIKRLSRGGSRNTPAKEKKSSRTDSLLSSSILLKALVRRDRSREPTGGTRMRASIRVCAAARDCLCQNISMKVPVATQLSGTTSSTQSYSKTTNLPFLKYPMLM